MRDENQLDFWFLENLVCPIDKSKLTKEKNKLICKESLHSYPIYKNIPIMLVKKETPTHSGLFQSTWDILNGKIKIDENLQTERSKKIIDPFVQKFIGETNSELYRHLKGKLKRYPIPSFPMNHAKGKLLLDIGCSWGRWCISAYKSEFSPVGIDPDIECILAAKRVAKQLGIDAKYLIADARFLPFRRELFDYCYSYSVLQHFSKPNVKKVLSEVKYVLKAGGISQIQMLNKYGLRSLYVQLKRIFQKSEEFETNYWSPNELLDIFEQNIGFSKILLASFFTQGQSADRDLFKSRDRFIFEFSQLLIKINQKIPLLTKFADNLFLISKKDT